jgi:hypothetical protein
MSKVPCCWEHSKLKLSPACPDALNVYGPTVRIYIDGEYNDYSYLLSCNVQMSPDQRGQGTRVILRTMPSNA